MGFLGKLLVLVHSLLSLGMLTWAIGLYTQRINWKSPDQKDPGVFDRQKAKMDELTIGMDRAYFRWTSNVQSVRIIEDTERYPRREFYQLNLNLVSTGRASGRMADPVVNPAVYTLTLDPKRFLNVALPMTSPPMRDPAGQSNLKSIVGYEQDINATYEAIAMSQKDNRTAIDEREKVNNEIIDVTNPKLIKGLRTRINEQKVIEDEANKEISYVDGFSTIREAEFGLLKKRKDALTYRLDELKK